MSIDVSCVGELPLAGAESPVPAGHALMAWCDGASKNNPGPAASGVVYGLEDGTPLAAEGESLGTATNNVAEYKSLILALRRLVRWGGPKATVLMDSQLVIYQMSGRYKVKNAGLKPLWTEAKELAAALPALKLAHVPRAENALADRAANLALEGKLGAS